MPNRCVVKAEEPRSEDRGSKVRKGGLDPPRPKAQEPKSCVSANFTTRARRRRPKVPGGPDDGCQRLFYIRLRSAGPAPAGRGCRACRACWLGVEFQVAAQLG